MLDKNEFGHLVFAVRSVSFDKKKSKRVPSTNGIVAKRFVWNLLLVEAGGHACRTPRARASPSGIPPNCRNKCDCDHASLSKQIRESPTKLSAVVREWISGHGRRSRLVLEEGPAWGCPTFIWLGVRTSTQRPTQGLQVYSRSPEMPKQVSAVTPGFHIESVVNGLRFVSHKMTN